MGIREQIEEHARDCQPWPADVQLSDGRPLQLPPLSLVAKLQTRAVTAATLAANLYRENRNRLHPGSTRATDLTGHVSSVMPADASQLALHQIVPTMTPYDAVSNDALAVQAWLLAGGFRSDVFAEHIHHSLRGRVRSLEALDGPGVDSAPAMYHVSTQASRVVAKTLARSGPLFLRHHNITPAEWFAGISLGHEAACRGAREEFSLLCRHAAAVLADSPYNAAEVIAQGVSDVTVVPIVLAESTVAKRWSGGGGYAISVGRIAPNKRIDFLLRTVAAYQQLHDPNFGLVLVGSDRGLERYGAACRNLERDLGVRNVRWVGSVEEAEKLRLMAAADVYLCASDHEGFCVPIVESFRLGLPVVARATSAVTDTCGEALAVDTSDPAFLANVMRVVISDADLQTRLIATQDLEARRFDPSLVGEQVLAWAHAHVVR